MIHINSREHLKQRQEVKPLTMEQEDRVVEILSFKLTPFFSDDEEQQLLQNFIYLYENYKHFFIITQSKADNMEVQYEIVKSKMNN